ncbi:hypothetical protein PF005_g31885 [Phytophthora fragariae]|uniref:Secreted protein n=1 Tax=Phytophthora fragariae TaxID=53985 RepID=A0A6A3VL10_9STRA|nr:hypothetical protein PF003_g2100 [Phytophthora fragariae]KAE8917779.1 hypothetical protein PF009_g31902 [Phytophthora fragariae]KAE8958710.1 hypothetical protein PF011_g30668 [Phytophthora fragariae]KAE9057089.1 hypothetical protein PF010_g31511 [Phytophthora fragariae]KAE9057940.1 hypothetical protein PF007_g31478 [Phytophthora fragariae]
MCYAVHAQLLYLLEACCATTCRANTTKAERQMAMCGSQKGPSTAGRFRSGSIPGTDYSNVTGMYTCTVLLQLYTARCICTFCGKAVKAAPD